MFLKTGSDETDVKSLGRLFHTFTQAARKARPLTCAPMEEQNIDLFSRCG